MQISSANYPIVTCPSHACSNIWTNHDIIQLIFDNSRVGCGMLLRGRQCKFSLDVLPFPF